MGLRSKVLAILLGMWLITMAGIYTYSTSALLNDYLALEKNEAVKGIDRTRKTLTSILSPLKILNGDWSRWDDAYNFMQNKNQAFINSNLTASTFANASMNLILFFDAQGKLFYGKNYDTNIGQFIPLPADLINQLETNQTFSRIHKLNDLKTGILKTSEGNIILAASPIVTSMNTGPIRGTLIMGSFFTDQQLAALSELTDIQTTFTPLPLKTTNDTYATVLAKLNSGASYYLHEANSHLLYGYTLVKDIQGAPIGIIRIESPRTLFNEGIRTIHKYLAIIALMGALFITMVWFLLEKLILDRMISISKQIININSESKFGNRIATDGNDELANMASAVNSLLKLIEGSQVQLKGRIQQRTEALEQISQINKNLYTEISRQKEVESRLMEDKQTLRQMAYYDTLTGLPNRQSFNEILRKTLADAEAKHISFAIMFLDVDRFKAINDTYGHIFGDQFLIITAARLQYAIHNKAIAARISGDEFNIIINNVTDRDALDKLAANILAAISAPVTIDETTVHHTFSIGISIYPYDGLTIDTLRDHADIAMYHAKKQPKNAFYYYEDIKNNEPSL